MTGLNGDNPTPGATPNPQEGRVLLQVNKGKRLIACQIEGGNTVKVASALFVAFLHLAELAQWEVIGFTKTPGDPDVTVQLKGVGPQLVIAQPGQVPTGPPPRM